MRDTEYRFLAIGTLKGGVGKSTTVVSIASILASMGKSVLVIDADPQANTSTYLGLDETAEGYKCLKDVFENRNISPVEVVMQTEIENLSIIGGTIYLTATERKFNSTSFAEQQLKKYLDRNTEYFNQFDYIIADTNPSMSKINQNVFVASNKILCVSDVGIGAHKGIELFDYLLGELAEESELDLKIDAILLNKYRKVNKLSKEYQEYMVENDLTKDLLLKSNVRDSVRFAEAELEQKPITLYKPAKDGLEDFKNVVHELIERGIL
ncbi:ParA family protein [Clostridium perfringens]|uniref:ParA family protein n=1 Tax=Clostridium perfringens TaxID=1502 RepID=UPI0018E45ADA|nr:ParA family protein [Clostridium perfringens]MBI5995661.1 ParA family protein [Clostridium perfringens]MBI6001349.1 ParA family protein [Clostridium perfringens]